MLFNLKTKPNIGACFLLIFLLCIIIFTTASDPVWGSSPAVQLNDVAEISITDKSGNRYNEMQLLDGRYTTKLNFPDTTEISINASEKIYGVYIIWDQPPGAWSLQVDEGIRTSMYLHGKNGFIHEYVSLDIPSASLSIITSNQGSSMSEIQIYASGDLPESVQLWELPYEDADMLLLPTHADDEHLFFGGTMPYYAGELKYKLQVAYLTNHWAEPYRPHELLNGLWQVGIRADPVIGDFVDYYSDALEHAKTLYDTDEMLAYEVYLLRRFKPEVVIGHDIDGEYGHGVHILNTWILQQAIQLSGDESYLPEQIKQYGTFSTSKVYLHLYPENAVSMNWDLPLDAFDGKTAFEMAKLGFSKHISQQEWFSVRKEGVHDCRAFGLYYTNVGYDSQGGQPDFFENITAFSDEIEEAPADEPATMVPDDQEVADDAQQDALFSFLFSEDSEIRIPLIVTGILLFIFLTLVIWGRRRNRR